MKTRKFKLFYFQNETWYRAKKLWKDIHLGNLSLNEGKHSVGLAVLNFRIWWRHVKTKNIIRNIIQHFSRSKTEYRHASVACDGFPLFHFIANSITSASIPECNLKLQSLKWSRYQLYPFRPPRTIIKMSLTDSISFTMLLVNYIQYLNLADYIHKLILQIACKNNWFNHNSLV